jgi:hypothetical protein
MFSVELCLTQATNANNDYYGAGILIEADNNWKQIGRKHNQSHDDSLVIHMARPTPSITTVQQIGIGIGIAHAYVVP